MLSMKNHMDIDVYEDFLKKWGDMNSDTEKMQHWVDEVRSHIGLGVYEEIKRQFLKEEQDKKDMESRMNCTQTFSTSRVVQFKKNIGADLFVEEDLKTFKEGIEVILHGVVI